MGYRVRELPGAKAELETELSWLSQFSKKAAAKLVRDYREKVGLLASGAVTQDPCTHPVLGKLGYRKALVGKSHLVLYYIEGDDLVVAHFFSQRQDYASLV